MFGPLPDPVPIQGFSKHLRPLISYNPSPLKKEPQAFPYIFD